MRAALSALLMVGCGGLMSDPPPDAAQTIPDASTDLGRKVSDDGWWKAPDVIREPCGPADVSGFTPGPLKPPRVSTGACTQSNVDAYYAACLDKATSSTSKCTTFTSTNKTCASCIVSNKTDSTWGPLVAGKGIISANVSGCIVLETGDSSVAGCGYKYQAEIDCEAAACEYTMGCLGDDQSFAEYLQCIEAARTNGCKTYNDAKSAACSVDSAPDAQVCLSPTDFKGYYDAIAPLFCAGGG